MTPELDGEIGLVYRADVDEGDWPEDPSNDARFLVCSQEVKERTFTALWAPAGPRLGITFELMEIHDLTADNLETVRDTVARVRVTAEGVPWGSISPSWTPF